jgi:hypothetical protein
MSSTWSFNHRGGLLVAFAASTFFFARRELPLAHRLHSTGKIGEVPMSRFAAFSMSEPRNASLSLGEMNAALFYHLAQFVVWCEEHGDISEAHPDLTALLKTATKALMKVGMLEQANSTASSAHRATNSIEDSQTLASRAASEETGGK